MFNGWALNTDFADFLRASTDTSLRFDAVTQAWAQNSGGRRLQEKSWRHNVFNIVYYKENGNLLEEENLLAIRDFEHWLQASEAWTAACGMAVIREENFSAPAQYSCSPGESFVNFVWPRYGANGTDLDGVSVGPGEQQRLYLDGSGPRRFSVEVAIASFWDVPMKHQRLERLFPEDFVPPEGGAKASTDTLRSFFLFTQSIGADGYYRSFGAANDAKQQFFGGDLHGLLNTYQPQLQELGIRVFYTSGQLDQADLFSALLSDILLSLLGLAAIFFLICLHTQSLELASIGSLLVVECMPLGYVFFKQFSGLLEMSIVNCVSTFVIIGIGSDMIFVLTDAWRQSARVVLLEDLKTEEPEEEEEDKFDRACRAHERYLQKRLAWVYSNAGVSCITTGLCGASSFLVNLMSVLMPLREFGLFMGLCVIWAICLELVMYPMALVARDRRKFRKQLAQQERELEDGSAWTDLVVQPAIRDSQVAPSDSVGYDPAAQLKGRSWLVRFFASTWCEFISNYKKWVLAGFAILSLISLVGVAASLQVDGSMPVIFPASHNQVLGREVRSRFKSAAGIAATSALDAAYICDVAAEQFSNKPDTLSGCGSFISLNYCNNEFEGAMRNQCGTSCGFEGYCLASWCQVDAAPNVSKSEPGRCDCYQSNDAQTYSASNAAGISRFETTIVGFDQDAWPALGPYLESLFMEMLAPVGVGQERFYSYSSSGEGDTWETSSSPSSISATAMAPLVQQHWRSGTLATWRSFQAPRFSVKTVPVGNQLADSTLPETVVRQQCFCDGIQPCTTWSAQKREVYHASAGPGGSTWVSSVDVAEGSTRRLDNPEELEQDQDLGQDPTFSPPSRRLQATPASWVEVVWGLEVRQLGPFDLFLQTETEQLWSWDTTFDPADPWAQRSIMDLAENMPEDLKKIPTTSFIEAFEIWLKSQNLEYPARNFHSSMNTFLESEGQGFKTFVLRDAANRVVALKLGFKIAVTFSDGLAATSSAMMAWDRYLDYHNELSSLGANKAFHVSSLWVNVEAQDGILRSTVTTITSAILIGYLAAVLFTQDLVLAFFPMLSVLLTVIALLFTMVGILQWPFGPVDVISLIVFLGYMFTFNLHVAQYYNHAKIDSRFQEDLEPSKAASGSLTERAIRRRQEERFCRVTHALSSVGQSLVCSAGTTTASAVFLLCCILQFFVKFGGVILSVTMLSLLHSLLFLPAFLMVCGPTSDSCMPLKRATARLREKVFPPPPKEPEVRTEVDTSVRVDPSVPLPPPAVSPPVPRMPQDRELPPLETEKRDSHESHGGYVRQLDSHEEEV